MASTDYAIDVNSITKTFKIYYDKGSQLKERILFKKRNKYEERVVLNNISFSISRGQAIGLIGQNGCGKSTTLKLLSRIMYPDSGSIHINGRVSSLIELGAGFHPDMSGRENIYTNASIFGLTKKEIDARLNNIIKFSELEEYIDNPVRTYSSGMYMRLAFSVAINVNADILLIDEILAVGDTNFQIKCFDKLRELKASGVTIIIVTHDLSTIEKFCDQVIWLENGVIMKSGKASEVVDLYYNFMNEKRADTLIKNQEELDPPKEVSNPEKKLDTPDTKNSDSENENSHKDVNAIDYSLNRFGLKFVEIIEARMINNKGKNVKVFHTGDDLTIEIDYNVTKNIDECVFGFGFYSQEGVCLYGNNTQLDRAKIIPDSSGSVSVSINNLPLLAGKYILNVAVVDKDGTPMDFYRNYCSFDVISNDRSVGYISINHEWSINK